MRDGEIERWNKRGECKRRICGGQARAQAETRSRDTPVSYDPWRTQRTSPTTSIPCPDSVGSIKLGGDKARPIIFWIYTFDVKQC